MKVCWRIGLAGLLSLLWLVTAGQSQEAVDDHGSEPSPLIATLISADNFLLEGTLETPADEDCFMFEAQSGAHYAAVAQPSAQALVPALVLYDRNGLAVLAVGAKDAAGRVAIAGWQPLVTGFYYLCVRSALTGPSAGGYTLTVQSDRTSAAAPQTLTDPPNSGNATNPQASEDDTAPPAEETPASQEGAAPENPPSEAAPPAETPPPVDAERPSADSNDQSTRIGVLGADDSASLRDVQSYLLGTGAFSAVDLIDTSQTTPSADELDRFSAVLVWSDSGFKEAQLLGDQLADYVDRGGGVVVAAVSFDASNPFDPDAIGGRFDSQAYYVIAPGVDNTDEGRRTLGRLNDASHPIVQGISEIDGGPRSFHSPTVELTSGGQAVALWDNGDVLLAVKTVGQTRRADVNLFPPSGRVDSEFWPFRPSNHVPLLFANALLWVAGRI